MQASRFRQLTHINRALRAVVDEIVAISNDVEDLEWGLIPHAQAERRVDGRNASEERDARERQAAMKRRAKSKKSA